MANFPEPASPNFDAIRIIETNDPVLGGAAEIAGTVNSPVNYALRALVARTQWLRQRVEGISVPPASRATAGIARLASLAQVNAGTDDETIVTPYLLQQKVSGLTPPNASESVRGLARIATQAKADAGTDILDFITSALLKRRIDAAFGNPPNVTIRPRSQDSAFVSVDYQYQLGKIVAAVVNRPTAPTDSNVERRVEISPRITAGIQVNYTTNQFHDLSGGTFTRINRNEKLLLIMFF